MFQRRLRAASALVLLSFILTGCPRTPQEIDPEFGAETGETDVFAEEGIEPGSSLDRYRRGEYGADAEQAAGIAPGPLSDIYFAYDSFDISEETRDRLRSNADWLRRNSGVRVEIEGHCDERGTVEYNLALGAKRARATKEYLVALGISPSRLTTISYGEELPVCYDANESCWAKNRRVHFVTRGE